MRGNCRWLNVFWRGGARLRWPGKHVWPTPEAALREGLRNEFFAHRDYSSFSGGPTVSVFADRIEIWNTGRLPEGLKLADLKRNHPSLPPIRTWRRCSICGD